MFLALILLLSSFVVAEMPGTTPHGFYGTVAYSDEVLILEDLEIRAEIGEYETSFSLIGGTYDLVVESESSGEIVYFYLEGLTNSIGSYDFESFEITELDFTTSLTNPNQEVIPSPSGGGGGGGGGGSYTPSTVIDGVVVLNEQEDEETEIIDSESGETEEQTAGTGLGAVIGFVKSGAGIGLICGLIVVVLAGVVMVVRKRK